MVPSNRLFPHVLWGCLVVKYHHAHSRGLRDGAHSAGRCWQYVIRKICLITTSELAQLQSWHSLVRIGAVAWGSWGSELGAGLDGRGANLRTFMPCDAGDLSTESCPLCSYGWKLKYVEWHWPLHWPLTTKTADFPSQNLRVDIFQWSLEQIFEMLQKETLAFYQDLVIRESGFLATHSPQDWMPTQ